MPTSAVSICSNALLLLGDESIDSFDVDNARTRLCVNLFPMKRDRVLRSHPWNCAIKRVVLSPDTTEPAFGWAYKFPLPGDCLRVLSVGDEENGYDEYEIEGGYILMDSTICRLRYIFRNEEPATWDALLVDAMTQVMVAALTYPITKSTTKQASEEQIVKDVLKAARTVDGQENPPETMGDFPTLAHRLA